jgi:hypothetical protein
LEKLDVEQTAVFALSVIDNKENCRVFSIPLGELSQRIQRWTEGMPVQYALPMLSASEREFIVTGITEEQWNMLFK